MIFSGHQPNYLPYLGFFDKMAQCDVFFIMDDVKFGRHDFHHRNKIKTEKGAIWLSVPIEHIGKIQQIREVKIAKTLEAEWRNRHWTLLKMNYKKAPFWSNYCDFFEQTFNQKWEYLLDLNLHLIKGIMGFLKINTTLITNSSLSNSEKGTRRFLLQGKTIGANVYISGVGGHSYLDIPLLEKAGIKVIFQDFQCPVYRQMYDGFISNLSVIDYLFCTGGISWNR